MIPLKEWILTMEIRQDSFPLRQKSCLRSAPRTFEVSRPVWMWLDSKQEHYFPDDHIANSLKSFAVALLALFSAVCITSYIVAKQYNYHRSCRVFYMHFLYELRKKKHFRTFIANEIETSSNEMHDFIRIIKKEQFKIQSLARKPVTMLLNPTIIAYITFLLC